MKRLLALFLVLIVALTAFAACGSEKATEAPDTSGDPSVTVKVGAMTGPTGIGMVKMMEDYKESGSYAFTVKTAADQLSPMLLKGELDAAAVPANLAAVLYNKSEGKIRVAAINTLGVLSILERGESIKTLADLKGKTIYMLTTAKGSVPDYTLRYLLSENGVDPDKDLTVKFVADGSELPAVWANDPTAVIMAPQPVATSILMKYTEAKTAFDMTEEWAKVSGAQNLMMGCVIVRNEYLEKNPGAVKTFLKEYEESINAAKTDAAGTGTLCEKYGIIPKAAIATKAIPACGLTYVDGADMKAGLSAYLDIMFKANPKSVGGALPADGFYYVGK